MTTIRLEAPGYEALTIDRDSGYIVRRFDTGDAVVRAVAQDAPDADGTIDTTSYVGARPVTLQVRLVPRGDTTMAAREAKLRAFTSPRIRPTLIFQRDGMPEQRITLRRSQFSAPEETQESQDVTVQWIAPLGIVETVEQSSELAYAAGTSIVGRTYPRTYDRVYPASSPLGQLTVTNDGTADAYPVIRLYGPCTEPKIDNLTQGKSLAFVGLTVAAGDYVEIDARSKTVLLNSDPGSPLYPKLDFASSDWWTLSPGPNVLWFHPATFTQAVTVAQVTWRDAWL